ncbi:hypothetical protein L1887_48494 [Cichorium endivia]|nr:hypothetical protein L1887_48494 [Cichorium endivia]
MGVSLAARKHPVLTTLRDTKAQVTPVGEVALSIPSGDGPNVVLAKPTSWVSGGEKRTWGLGSGRSVTKGFHLGRDKMGGHGRSGVRADWSDDDYFTY